jgi:hypothetical protein
LCSFAGFEQVLVEICTPVPQVVEHSENSLHVSQPPSTKMNKVKERLLVSSHAITKMHAQVRIVVANII